MLTNGLEIAGVLLLKKPREAPQFLSLVAAVNAAAGSPWGHDIPTAGHVHATAGNFNGLWASAVIDGAHYTLGPPEDPPEGLEAVGEGQSADAGADDDDPGHAAIVSFGRRGK